MTDPSVRARVLSELFGMFETAGLQRIDAMPPGILPYILYYNPDPFPLLKIRNEPVVRALWRLVFCALEWRAFFLLPRCRSGGARSESSADPVNLSEDNDMKLYWCPKTRSTRALWMLEETNQPYERVLIDIRDPQAKKDPGFVAVSPMGKVPALEDGDAKMAESAALCLYVADRYAPGKLAPLPDDPARGRFLYWMFFTPGVIEPAMAEKVGGWETNRGQHGWGDYESMIETLESGLTKGPWLLGDQFSAADVMVGSSVVFLRMFDLLPESPPIHAHADRCLERPAYQRALAIDAAG